MSLDAGVFAQLTKQLSRNQILSVADSKKAQISMWSGSVGAGKTHASLLAFLMAIPKAPTRGLIVIIGQTLDTVYANLFSLMTDPNVFGQEIAESISYTRGAKTAIILGREVLIVGAKDSSGMGRVQGSTVGLMYVDEAVLLLENVWNMLTTRLRVPGARLLATMNPGSANHYLHKKWIKEAASQGVVHFTLTMDDNPFYDNDWGTEHKRQMKSRYSGLFYDRFIRGLWTNAEGAVFPMWDPKRHVVPFSTVPRMQRVLGVGIDFGVTNPTRGLMLGISRELYPRLYLLDEFDITASETHRVAPSIQADKYLKWLDEPHAHYDMAQRPERHILDPSAAPLYEELKRQGLQSLHLGENKVLPGVLTLSNLLSNDQIRVVDGRCPRLEEEFPSYIWSAKKTAEGIDDVVKENDHSLDAARYVTHSTRSIWRNLVATPEDLRLAA